MAHRDMDKDILTKSIMQFINKDKNKEIQQNNSINKKKYNSSTEVPEGDMLVLR